MVFVFSGGTSTGRAAERLLWGSCFLFLKRRMWNSCYLFPLLSFVQTLFGTSLAVDQRVVGELLDAGVWAKPHTLAWRESLKGCRRTGMCFAWYSSRTSPLRLWIIPDLYVHIHMSILRNVKGEEGQHLKLPKEKLKILTKRKRFWKIWRRNAPSSVLLLVVPR